MGEIKPDARLKPAPPCKFFFALSWAQDGYCKEVESSLESAFGALHLRSDIFNFSRYSKYYDHELGGTVFKYLVAVEKLMPADHLIDAKLRSEAIQWGGARNSKENRLRIVNIDAGYLNGWQVVLSTVKNQAHRIYLDRGVFGEVTLIYRKVRYEPLSWTYPDYSDNAIVDFLKKSRKDYRLRIRREGIGR